MKNTKRALFLSALAIVMSVAMLIGSTFAWFTDSASTAVNTIQSGTLKVALEMFDVEQNKWVDAEGQTLEWVTEDDVTNVIWEPNCTYKLPLIRVRNDGNLAIKYEISVIGVTGDSKLLEVIDFTASIDGKPEVALDTFTGHLDAKNASSEILIKGHMDKDAGNDYQDEKIENIAISVLATQYTYESDSNDNQYDKDATYLSAGTVDELKTAIAMGKPVTLTDDITMNTGSFTVASGTNAVIDLGGNNLTVTNADTSAAFLKVEGDLTITGEGNVDVIQINTSEGSTLTLGEGVTISTSNSFAINNQGTTVIDGATINHTGTNHAILNDYGTLIINDATVTSTSTKNISTISSMTGKVIIEGGTFIHEGSMGSVICDPYGDSEIIINGGTFIQKDGDPLVNMGMTGKLTINGGTFDSTSMFCNLETAITIHAGVFKNNATVTDYGFGSISSMIPATSTATTNADGSVTVTVNQ